LYIERVSSRFGARTLTVFNRSRELFLKCYRTRRHIRQDLNRPDSNFFLQLSDYV